METIELLVAARRVADFATSQGASQPTHSRRRTCDHMGAVLADSILQAGLNYSSVVRPRVDRIQELFPQASRTSALIELVELGGTSDFLSWNHKTKVMRFEYLVAFISEHEIDNTIQLKARLNDPEFCVELRKLNGIGPKTIDYMSCLVGIESIAVDRHIKNYAAKVGVENGDYEYLKRVFCFAADLMSISRREFDAWVWSKESKSGARQLAFELSEQPTPSAI